MPDASVNLIDDACDLRELIARYLPFKVMIEWESA